MRQKVKIIFNEKIKEKNPKEIKNQRKIIKTNPNDIGKKDKRYIKLLSRIDRFPKKKKIKKFFFTQKIF